MDTRYQDPAFVAAAVDQLGRCWATFDDLAAGIDQLIAAANPKDTSLPGALIFDQFRLGEGSAAVVRDDIIEKLIDLAIGHFSPPGKRIAIDRNAEKTRWRQITSGRNRQPFTPAAAWSQLAEAHGNGKAAERVYRDCANNLVRYFGLKDQQPMQSSSWGATLEVSCYSEPRNYGGRRLNYTHSAALTTAMQSLEVALGLIPQDDVQAQAAARMAVAAVRTRFEKDQDFETRGLESHAPHLELRLYNAKIVFRLSWDLAACINEFVGTYSDVLREAA